jgi:hypothetical protein
MGANPKKNRKGEGHPRAAVKRDQSAASQHPALIALVRLLARQAAAEWLAASGGSSPLSENLNDQDNKDSQT